MSPTTWGKRWLWKLSILVVFSGSSLLVGTCFVAFAPNKVICERFCLR